jgi:hypothetical protein
MRQGFFAAESEESFYCRKPTKCNYLQQITGSEVTPQFEFGKAG